MPILRIETEDGLVGFGACRATPDRAAALIGQRSADLFASATGVIDAWQDFDYPLWDLAGKHASQPVYALTGAMAGATHPAPFSAPCYDTSLYFDDLHLADDHDAAQLIVDAAQQGYDCGHCAFKIKVGRGARHMPSEAARAALGADVALMIGANNGGFMYAR